MMYLYTSSPHHLIEDIEENSSFLYTLNMQLLGAVNNSVNINVHISY